MIGQIISHYRITPRPNEGEMWIPSKASGPELAGTAGLSEMYCGRRPVVNALLAVSLLVVSASAQEQVSPKPVPTPNQSEQERQNPRSEAPKPAEETARERAKALLDSAAETVSTTVPGIQAAALMHLGEHYREFDRGQAVEYLRQAFAVADTLPAQRKRDHRGDLQARIVRTMAPLDLQEAMQLFRRLPQPAGDNDYRTFAALRIVVLLLKEGDVDGAISFVDTLDPGTEYPYIAAEAIFKKLPADDPRRVEVFGNAMAAYPGRPDDAFHYVLSRHWQEIPRPMARSALRMVVDHIMRDKEEDKYAVRGMATAEGVASFGSGQDSRLFNLMPLLEEFDPKRAKELLDKRAELRRTAEAYPEGNKSMESKGKGGEGGGALIVLSAGGQKPDAAQEAKMQARLLSYKRAAAARNELPDDPDKALSLVPTIPMPGQQAEVLGAVALTIGGTDPRRAKGLLRKCVEILDEIEHPSERARLWEKLVEAADATGDEKLTWEYVDRAMRDVAELYDKEAAPDDRNPDLREDWSSTSAYRGIIWRATKVFGLEAEALLSQIRNPDLALLARIQMAGALLGHPKPRFR